jgi:hypothetical protein
LCGIGFAQLDSILPQACFSGRIRFLQQMRIFGFFLQRCFFRQNILPQMSISCFFAQYFFRKGFFLHAIIASQIRHRLLHEHRCSHSARFRFQLRRSRIPGFPAGNHHRNLRIAHSACPWTRDCFSFL